jgi:methylphosphotriester-DNA--protein-cysteine methyltransferase
MGTTPRTLERLFDRHVGMPPKRLARLERFQAVLRRAGDGGDLRGLRDAALAAGYFDQAHFLREFRAFAGVSPSTFFGREDNAMSSAFTGAADS